MSILLIPVAPLSRTKSRLRDSLTNNQLKDLTIAMFKDLIKTLIKVKCFDKQIVYCNTDEILDFAEDYGLIGIKENLTNPPKSFDEIIKDINDIAINKFNAKRTILTFIDIILINARNFNEINEILKNNQLLVCPAIQSAGISILGRNPPDIIPTFFSDPNIPSLLALIQKAKDMGIKKISIYDSFRAGFDVDVKQDIVLAYNYLKSFNLTHTETYQFLKKNLNLTLRKINADNNRAFRIIKKM
jgi:2-phospho-L-lactate guanylyltransferase (CobY/MobA/RfbA family)